MTRRMLRFAALWCAAAMLCACACAETKVHVTVVADFTTDAEAKDGVATVAAVRSLVRTLGREAAVIARADVVAVAPAGLSLPLRDALEAATSKCGSVFWKEPFANEAAALNAVFGNSSDVQEDVLHMVLDAYVDPDDGFFAAARDAYAAAREKNVSSPLVLGFLLRNPDDWTVYHAGLDVSAAALALGTGTFIRSAAAAAWPRNVPTPHRLHAGMPVEYARKHLQNGEAYLLGTEAFALDARTFATLGTFDGKMTNAVFLLDYALRAHNATNGSSSVQLCTADGASAVFLASASTQAARESAAYTMATLEPLFTAWLGVLQARVSARVHLAPQSFVWSADCGASTTLGSRARLGTLTTTLLALAELQDVLDVRAEADTLTSCVAALRAAQYPVDLVGTLERVAQRDAPPFSPAAAANTTLLLQREPARYTALVRAHSGAGPVRRALGLCQHAGSAVPADWAAAANSHAVQQLLVPTSYGVTQLVHSGVNATPIAVLSPPVDTDLFSPDAVAASGGKTTRNSTFAFVAQDAWEPRSALPELITAYIDAFGAEDDVSLTLRLVHADPYDLAQAREAISAAVEAKLSRCNSTTTSLKDEQEGESSCTLPRLPVLDTEFVPWVQLPRKMGQFDVFVTAARATGFGRATAEAMALGMPVVALNASARAAYLDADCAYLVPVAAHDPIAAVQPGITWARVDVPALARALRRAHRDRGTRTRALGRRAREVAVAHFSRTAFRERLLALLADADHTLPTYDPDAVVVPSTPAASAASDTTGTIGSTFLNDRPTRIRINP